MFETTAICLLAFWSEGAALFPEGAAAWDPCLKLLVDYMTLPQIAA